MRIVGKGKRDYYDSCLGYGQDPNLCYVRNPIEHDSTSELYDRAVKLKMDDSWTWRAWNIDAEFDLKIYHYRIVSGLIGFCGIIYPYVQITKRHRGQYGYQPDDVNCFYDEKSYIGYLRSEGWVGKSYEKNQYMWSGRINKRRSVDFFERAESPSFFFDLGQPVYAVQEINHRMMFVENPCLKDLQFYKVFDAYSTWQELSMFIGGILGQAHPPMVKISNEDMARKKGFGHKYAFRKEPTKKR